MGPILRRKNTTKIRQNILRGVYEENLSLLGRGRPPLSRPRIFTPKRIFLCAVALLIVFFAYGQYVGTSSSRVELPEDMSGVLLPILRADASLGSGEKTSDFSTLSNTGNLPLRRMLGLRIRRIMIDAGHGGSDPGTIGKMGTMEKEITLDIGRRLKTHLVEGGRHVSMTREDDSSVPLHERLTHARKVKADLFISIHVNHHPNSPINMVETYYFGPSNDERTLKLARQENAGSEYGLSDFKEVVEKLGTTMKFQESKELAQSIQTKLFLNSRKHSEDIKDYGVKRAPFAVLLGVEVPSVLAEVSCLSNSDEEQELNSESHRENIATYLAAGIFAYLNKGATHEARR